MKSEAINLQAYKYAESTLSKFNEICSPLFKSSINIFAYFRFFNDGRYLYLCNDLSWLRYCLENVHNNQGTSLGEEISHVPEDNYYYFLWPTTRTDYLMSALYDFNIWNGLSLFKQREDSIELWGFAANRQAEQVQNFYVENIGLLKAFTASFNLKAAEIISPSQANLAIYRDFIPSLHINEYDSKKITEFIKATPINKRPLITPTDEVFLTTRELECLNLLASGKNSKQVANLLSISTRTVEKNFENIKKKVSADDKVSIVKHYKNSVINWL